MSSYRNLVKQQDAPLEPVVKEGEERKYIVEASRSDSFVGKWLRSKWRHCEGTEVGEDRIYEEEEIRATNHKTQDDVVNTFIAV